MKCPYCNSNIIIKIGKTLNNSQRYKCTSCKKTFLSVNKGKFERLDINKDEFISLLKEILLKQPQGLYLDKQVKVRYLNFLFNLASFKINKIKLNNKIIFLERRINFETMHGNLIDAHLVCLYSNSNLYLASYKTYLDLINLFKIHLSRNALLISDEKSYIYLNNLFNLNEVNAFIKFKIVNDLGAYKVNKKALDMLENYLKGIPDLTNKNLMNYVSLYTYFLQVKGSVNGLVCSIFETPNLEKFRKKPSRKPLI